MNNNGKKTGLSAALRTTKTTKKHNIQTNRANESKVVSIFSFNLLKHVYFNFKSILMIINKDLDLARFQHIIFILLYKETVFIYFVHL